ncbi:MAG: GNAT family N-acetyltransferase [Actinobacteria bacterium]|nr:GNAT family N-acetyltransferase [Actinomycetota bacterium]
MDENISLQDLTSEPLSEENIPSDFDCGDEDLNDFIINDALRHQNANVAMTTLVKYKGKTVGFYSLATDCISLAKEEKDRIKREYNIPYSEYPALKICRLGVQKDFQGKGIGRTMVYDVIGLALEIQEWIGLRFISVDAYQDSRDFYEKLGFLENHHENEADPRGKTISMRYDLEPTVWEKGEWPS